MNFAKHTKSAQASTDCHSDTAAKESKLGFVGLSALVFGMMVGAGIFNIPQNMAVYAGPQAIALAWIVTAAGMLLLVSSFRILSQRRPDLNAGLYLYARQGFGQFAGFLTAWGYWLCTAFANVAYAVMLNDTLGAIFPVLLRHSWPTFMFGSLLIWTIFFIVLQGMRAASLFNTLITLVKFGCIVLIIVLLLAHFNFDSFVSSYSADIKPAAGTASEIKDSMLVTLWCFIGIEGAVMMSGRARRRKDVGRAGIFGFFSAWILYVLVSLLCFGIMTRARLAGLEDPSIAYVLRHICGEWAYWLVIISVMISLGGGWIAWSLVCAEVPYTAACNGLFPRSFSRLSNKYIPVRGMLLSSIIMELFLVVVMFSDALYLTALSVTGMMILPAYLVAGLYLWKISRYSNMHPTSHPQSRLNGLAGYFIPWMSVDYWTGMACTLFCVWMIYAGGVDFFLQTSIFYLFGLGLHVKARRERGFKVFTTKEKCVVAVLVLVSVLSLTLTVPSA